MPVRKAFKPSSRALLNLYDTVEDVEAVVVAPPLRQRLRRPLVVGASILVAASAVYLGFVHGDDLRVGTPVEVSGKVQTQNGGPLAVVPQKEVNAGVRKPATVVAQKPAVVVAQKPVTAAAQPPAIAVTQKPATVVAQPPAVVVAQKPATAVAQPPAVVVAQKPATVVAQPPAVAVAQKPPTAVTQTLASAIAQPPALVVSQTLASAIAQPPAIVAAQKPAATVAQPPAIAVAQKPTTPIAQPPAIAAAQKPAKDAIQKPATVVVAQQQQPAAIATARSAPVAAAPAPQPAARRATAVASVAPVTSIASINPDSGRTPAIRTTPNPPDKPPVDVSRHIRAARAALQANNLSATKARLAAAIAAQPNNRDALTMRSTVHTREQQRDALLSLARGCGYIARWACVGHNAGIALSIDSSSKEAQRLAALATRETQLQMPPPAEPVAEPAPEPRDPNGHH
jgi:hypothetical protein